MKVKSLSHVWLSATPRTVAYQASMSMGFSRQEYWSELPFPSPGDLSQPRDRTQVSRIAGRCFTLWATREALLITKNTFLKLMTLVLLYVWEDARTWSHWNSFLRCPSYWNHRGLILFSRPESFKGTLFLGGPKGCGFTPCVTGQWVKLFFCLSSHLPQSVMPHFLFLDEAFPVILINQSFN